mmetsp:Transcript_60034/g.177991  ORF Transcript_60034/g.177991 Transcript_60034/m.177991 type:complete len:328 (-) Transcript_60034:481-1464(-)
MMWPFRSHGLVACLLLLLVNPFTSAFVPRIKKRSAPSFLPLSSSRPAIDWIVAQPLDAVLPKDDAVKILDEILTNDELIDDTESVVTRNWDKLESKLREETRTVADILGAETTDSVIKSVQNIDSYDPEAVRAFLGSNAVNELFAKVLYDGIYQFFQTIDVFGNIISKLPIIGPIRNQIRDETKRQLDRTVGPLIQNFLREYTKVAVGEASDFVMSPTNRKAFGNANARLVLSLMKRPVNSLVPQSDVTVKLREDAFEYVRKTNSDDLKEYVTFVYDLLGDKSVSKAVNVDRVLSASPTLQKTLDNMWEKATHAQEANTAETTGLNE